MREVDSLGRRCPQPIIDLALALRTFPLEDDFLLLSDDVATWFDLQAWSRMTGHQVQVKGADQFQILRSRH